jgi:hypothetical protein
MDVRFFRTSLDEPVPPADLGTALEALWFQGRGDWDRAHELAQAEDGRDGAWVHAHLHRVEGDQANTDYWYRRAGRPQARGDLQVEWVEIVSALLAARPART